MSEQTSPICPGCQSDRSTPFYRVPGVPVHQVKLVPSHEAALACQKGDIELRFCQACGFVWNAAFDASLMRYEEDYEFDPDRVADLQPLPRGPGARSDRALRSAPQAPGRGRLRPGRVLGHAGRDGRQSRLRLRPGASRPARRRADDLHQGFLWPRLSRPRARLRLLQDDAGARPRQRAVPARHAPGDGRPARGGDLLHDPRGHPDPRAARVLGRLLRALLLLQPGRARPPLPARRLRSDRRLVRL